MFQRVVLLLSLLCTFISLPTTSHAEGFGKVEWGASKEDVEASFNITLKKTSGYFSHFIFYMDQITIPKDFINYSTHMELFNNDFDAIFSFSPSGEFKQVILYYESNGSISVARYGEEILKKFESYFTRLYGNIYKSHDFSHDLRQYSNYQWLGKETFVHMISLFDLEAKYKYALEILIRQEDSPF